MGGAVGHLMHLYDNPDLHFWEMKDILSAAASGKLTSATEKLDGMNLVFTWDEQQGNVKVARAGGDIKRGGMNAEELAAKFEGRGNIKDAFDSAFSILSKALRVIPPEKRERIFGPSGDRWFSMEVIYTKNPNVINYDKNTLVFHGWPVFNVSGGEVEAGPDVDGSVDILDGYVNQMQDTVSDKSWQVKGPAIARLRAISDGRILDRVTSAIDQSLSSVGLSDSVTMAQYSAACIKREIGQLALQPRMEEMVIARCAKMPGAPSLVDIKKNLTPEVYAKVNNFVKESPKILKACVRPIELAINEFAVELLRGLKSTLINDNDAEVVRLRQEVSNAIANIRAAGDAGSMSFLQAQLEKLGSVDNVTTPVEGVVVIYKGNAYKFTGSFAAANMILGIFKYGKGSSKPPPVAEGRNAVNLLRLLIREEIKVC